MEKSEAKTLISNIISATRDLIHDVGAELPSKCKTDLQIIENNVKSLRMVLKLDDEVTQ